MLANFNNSSTAAFRNVISMLMSSAESVVRPICIKKLDEK